MNLLRANIPNGGISVMENKIALGRFFVVCRPPTGRLQ